MSYCSDRKYHECEKAPRVNKCVPSGRLTRWLRRTCHSSHDRFSFVLSHPFIHSLTHSLLVPHDMDDDNADDSALASDARWIVA